MGFEEQNGVLSHKFLRMVWLEFVFYSEGDGKPHRHGFKRSFWNYLRSMDGRRKGTE